MCRYIYTDGCVHLHHMSRRTQITLTDRQHAFLRDERERTGLPLAELVRRAVDQVYRPHSRSRVEGLELSVGVWRRPDAAVVGRRPDRVRRGGHR
jgi:hypothetical protein